MASIFEIAAGAQAAVTIGGQINQYIRAVSYEAAVATDTALLQAQGYAGGTPTAGQIQAFLNQRKGAGPGGLPESAFMGGYTPTEARRLLATAIANRPAMKNLFMVDIAGPSNQITAAEMGLVSEPETNGLSVEDAFSFFATEVSYGPITLEGEKKKIGAAQADTKDTSVPTEMTITFMDDERGTLKRWFRALSARTVASDGTVGVPADYCVTIEITHAIASQSASGFALSYSDPILMRPKSVEYELSRSARGDAQTFPMAFTQLDTFMSVRAVNPR